jgi:glycosyltransferase involved in cell wall biosynthesis
VNSADGPPSGAGRETAPLLSVITPSMNSAQFIEDALDSVAALGTRHEHIVIDGGSTDSTAQLLSRREDPSLTWISEPDQGQTHAVNKGLQRARGQLVAWLNADDAYVSENVDSAVRLLRENPSADAVFGFMDVVDEDGRFQRQYRCGPFSWWRYLYAGDYLPTPTIVFRRSLLDRVPRLDERYEDAADYDFYLRLLRGRRVLRLRRSLVRFRYHEASKTGSNIDLQQREALEIRLGFARNIPQRWAMLAIRHAKRLRGRIIAPWPEARKLDRLDAPMQRTADAEERHPDETRPKR